MSAITPSALPRYFLLPALAIITALCGPAIARAEGEHPRQWIWSAGGGADATVFLRFDFTAAEAPKSARLAATADNRFTLMLNGQRVTRGDSWSNLEMADIRAQLKPGKNTIAVRAENEGGPAAFFCELRLVGADDAVTVVSSNDQWRVTTSEIPGWETADPSTAPWTNAVSVGALGDPGLPWTASVDAGVVDDALLGEANRPFLPQVAVDLTAASGFVVEKIYDVPRGLGSWISLTRDDAGRLIASDQGDAGLFLITPGQGQTPTVVERLPVELSSAHGLCWAFDALYVMVNGGPKSGLHRLTDSDADGRVDHDEHLLSIPGGGEHGPHAVIPGPDGKSLWIACGNHTDLPASIQSSRLPMNWGEDHLLPRRWDANGHAAGRLAPGGWICQVDPNGANPQVVSMGYRNEYDIAFNGDGELFAYDADMEWDMGSPWYRPTRLAHATSGSEFGWRSGTGKWPMYYEDSLPPALNIGPGSPTGAAFGYGAKFPAKYQRALYLLDWTYGTIHAVHLTPEGSTYAGEREDFVFGNSLPVTDAIVGLDGALYFTAGGRGTRSSVYRVTYTGTESTEPVPTETQDPGGLRALRKQLEAWHGNANGNLAIIFAHLSHPDRFVRYAARVALESQDVNQWRERALAAPNDRATIQSMIALARQGSSDDHAAVLKTLLGIDIGGLGEQDRLAYYRALELACIRLGAPDEGSREALVQKLDPLYPSGSDPQNAELVQLLVYLQAPSVVSKTLDLMDSLGAEPIPDWSELAARNAGYGGTVARMLEDMPPVRGIYYAFVLRNATTPWTLEERRRYFAFFPEAARHPGGASFPGFLTQMREDALANVPAAERVLLDDLAGQSLTSTFESHPPQGPGRQWTTQEALAVLAEPLRGRNFDAGRNLFHATACAKCHRYNAEGGAIGPDLSTAAKKFSLPDLIDAMVEPSKAISDQYGSQNVLTVDGQVLVGRVIEVGDQISVYTADLEKPPIVLARADIEEMSPSKVSQMPTGLLDTLSEDELKDLVAYLLSGGNRNAAVFAK